MQTLDWLDTHLGTIEDAQDLINRFCWYLDILENNGKWYVTTGDEEKHVIFSADNRDAINTFIYGMALAYGGIPEHLLQPLENDMKDWVANL